MTELYREAAELLGLYCDVDALAYDKDDENCFYPYGEPGTPIILAHLICEKEGWVVTIDEDRLFRVVDRDNYGVKYCIKFFSDTPNAVIRAFVEKYGKKKDELPELQDLTKGVFYLRDPSKNEMEIAKRIDTIEKLILKSLKSLSERMDKMEDSKNKSDNSKKLCYEGINIKEVLDIHGETVRVANSDTVDKAVYPLYDAIKDINNRIDKWERVNGS